MKVFKITGRDGKRSACWYGKIRMATGRWSRRRKLFTDKTASERQLAKLQTEHDQRIAGVRSAETDRLALPIDELLKLYVASMRQQGCDGQHLRISEWMTKKLIEMGGWKVFADVTAASMEKILATLAAQGKTASYRNKFIVRAKAFVHWLLPDNWPDPLRKLRRVREKGTVRRRGRRAATDAEAVAFFATWSDLPFDRHLSYALAMLNGLRRNEIKRDDDRRLRWGQLHLNAPIPFVTLAQKNGDGQDCIPLHPYVVDLLRKPGMAKMPSAPVVGAVPDVSTLESDLLAARIKMQNAAGLRLDFHALRHTFQTNLDRTGCSRATKKKLMRHAAEDVTDGYAHAELAEMLTALAKLGSPAHPPATAGAAVKLKTGTHDAPADVSKGCDLLDRRLDQKLFVLGRFLSSTGTDGTAPRASGSPACKGAQADYTSAVGTAMRGVTLVNLRQALLDTVVGPSTQVD